MTKHHIPTYLIVAAAWALAACSSGDGSTPTTSASSGASGGGETGGGGAGAGHSGGGGTGGENTGGSLNGGGGEGGSTGCSDASDCDDGVSCTTDSCEAGVCVHAPQDSACDDGAFCNGSEICDPANGDPTSGCVAGADPCDDGIGCTQDSCDEASDSCNSVADASVCDDGLFCNGAEICDALNGDPVTGCLAAENPCDDGIGCTQDSCDEASDSCGHLPDDSVCDDALFCNGSETCDPASGDPTTGCVLGSAPCDDGIGCTQDSCDEASDSCSHVPNNGFCDDALFCNGAEICDPAGSAAASGCVPGSDPCDDGIACTQESCDEGSDSCNVVLQHALCDDGVFCNGAEACTASGCVNLGIDPNCSDGIDCTADFCDTSADACANVAQNSQCSDGVFCNGQETCDPVNGAPGTGCLSGTPVTCNDQIPCTQDSCSESLQACQFVPNHAVCDDGLYCNGGEICQAGVGCVSGIPVVCNDQLSCTSDSCDEVIQDCVFLPNDAACDDGLYCNGDELCDPNSFGPGSGCVAGAPVVCPPDAFACTDEVCDEAAMACAIVPDDQSCPMGELCKPQLGGCVQADPCQTTADCAAFEDGNLCNGTLVCHPTLNICEVDPATIVNCNDGISCTIDSCAPATGQCSHTLNHAQCDDGFVCNGFEICDPASGDPATGCVEGLAIDCDDGVWCTFDQCQEPTGTCSHQPLHAACDDGLFCTGSETCDAALDCQPGTPPSCNDQVACTVDSCNPATDACANVPDDQACPCGQTCDAQNGCGSHCVVTKCQGKVYQCGDCIDNDNDCDVDVGADAECFGPCDNNEAGFKGNIPGQNSAPCKQDCYFDGDTGAGNDDCYWSHKCDPYEVPPNYSPEGPACAYDPNANVPGTSLSCAQLQVSQSPVCGDFCGPLTPNGCDCFGCCEVPQLSYPIWLGSTDANGNGSCTTATLNDPNACKPCTIVQGCFNSCENCELCLGKDTLPPECLCQECPAGAQLCGAPCGGTCPQFHFCSNGCCVLAPG